MLKYLLPGIALAWCAFVQADEGVIHDRDQTNHPGEWGADTLDLNSAAWRVYLGHFVAPGQDQLKAPSDDISLGIGITADLLHYSFVGIDFAGFYFKHEVDSPLPQPPIGTLNEDARIETGAIMFGGRVFYPLKSDFRVYATGGLGYFRTRMQVYGSLFGFPGTYQQIRSTFAPYYGAGLSYTFGSWALTFDYRKIRLKEDFGDFNVTGVDVGGQAITIGVGVKL